MEYSSLANSRYTSLVLVQNFQGDPISKNPLAKAKTNPLKSLNSKNNLATAKNTTT